MGRNPRCYHPDGIYQLTAHGIDDRSIFSDDIDRQEFCLRYHRVVQSEGWIIYAACLVDTHYHLLVGPTLGLVSEGMRELNGGYSKAFNLRHERRGALFESRYRDWKIRDERTTRTRFATSRRTPSRAASPPRWTTGSGQQANENSPLKAVSDNSSPLSTNSYRSPKEVSDTCSPRSTVA
jgi:hypothetical protein